MDDINKISHKELENDSLLIQVYLDGELDQEGVLFVESRINSGDTAFGHLLGLEKKRRGAFKETLQKDFNNQIEKSASRSLDALGDRLWLRLKSSLNIEEKSSFDSREFKEESPSFFSTFFAKRFVYSSFALVLLAFFSASYFVQNVSKQVDSSNLNLASNDSPYTKLLGERASSNSFQSDPQFSSYGSNNEIYEMVNNDFLRVAQEHSHVPEYSSVGSRKQRSNGVNQKVGNPNVSLSIATRTRAKSIIPLRVNSVDFDWFKSDHDVHLSTLVKNDSDLGIPLVWVSQRGQ